MFQKPAFGSTTANFGSFNTNTAAASPFGGFKPTTGTSAFGAPPAFGAGATTQPATGGGLFGTTNTSGGLFGSTASTSTGGFGTPTNGFGFGSTTPSTGGLFGSNNSTNLFGNTQNQSAFGSKPAGFGFGATSATGTTGSTLFGAAPSTGTGLFGQQNNNMSGGGLFSSTTSAFGQPQQTLTGTAQVKYNPVVGTDVVVKAGTSQNVNIKHHCITCMKEYENKSLEELRLEDYLAGNKGSTGAVFGPFGQQQQTENKPLFPTQSAFSQPATTSAPSVFGSGTLGTSSAFGQTNSFSFGSNTQNNNNTTSLFGANKPTFGTTASTGTGLFGARTTQAQPATSTFGFGTTTPQTQTSLFGAKPATGFGSTGAFGTATTGTAFGTGGGTLFGAKTSAPAFGTTTPAFGTLSGGFGTSTSTSGGLFGSTFGKPTATQPAFGFTAQPTGLGTGLGTGVGANTFQAKPATAPFGTLNTTNMFNQPTQAPTFKTGLEGGLGGGIFGNTSTLGSSMFNLGGGLNTNTNPLVNTGIGASAGGNVHEQILTLAARPYGESPLFKDLLPDSSTTTAEDVLKPTNPVAVAGLLDKCQYRVTSPTATRLHLQPKSQPASDKKSLFEGLEEPDVTLDDKLSLKPSRKRLLLRNNHEQRDSAAHIDSDRCIEEQLPNGISQVDGSSLQTERDAVERARRQIDMPDNNSENTSDRHASWLSGSKVNWSDKEKSIDNEPTPRLYPNIDKDIQNQATERRASWLTTKPLRKPLVSNTDSAENSVRELGVRDISQDKETSDNLSVSEDEPVPSRESTPHPAGVKLTRPGYYTIPSLEEMINYIRPDGSCVVPHLTIGRKNYGNVYYDCEIDVAGMDLDSLVHFMNKEVIVYPEESEKPPLGEGLNRRAIVTLDRVWPRDKTEKKPITDPDRLHLMDYEGKLRRVCDKHDTTFVEYRPASGSWVFRVRHFSRYGLSDSDEEDVDKIPTVPAPPPARTLAPPTSLATSAGALGGLGGLSNATSTLVSSGIASGLPTGLVSGAPSGLNSGLPSGLSSVVPSGLSSMVPSGLSSGLPSGLVSGLGNGLMPEDNLYAMQQTSLNLLNGAGSAFEMDITEDIPDSQSLYMDNKVYGVKSPTGELARLEKRQSHSVQLMKASLYTDTEIEDDASLSTEDQLVPVSDLITVAPKIPSVVQDVVIEAEPVVEVDDIQMAPLIVRPHTIVQKYHRKVLPFKQTIAGRLDAAYIADMSVCRARHSRCGFGPGSVFIFPTSYDSVDVLPKSADISDLGRYVSGRGPNDWSEPIVVRMALGDAEKEDPMMEVLKKQLEIILAHSIFTEEDGVCPKLLLSQAAGDRLQVLEDFLKLKHQTTRRFGVSGAYCDEVWKLCYALWGADLANDGVPGNDTLSIVNRHRRLLEWMKDAVSAATDQDLSKPSAGEDEDETDAHSAHVWTLMLGGRILEACQLAKKHEDFNMAILIAQATGGPTFRTLITRQLSQWKECGAESLISSHRWAALQLVAGDSSSREKLTETDWLRALHATARYLCNPIPTLEQVIKKYEGFFTTDDDVEIDLAEVETDEMNMKLPLPPYINEYEATVVCNGTQRRILDLRYELIRARAYNTKPKISPEAYTPNPMDYTLCFLLGVWFGNPTTESVTGISASLEASGAWHLAVLALMYLPDTRRGHLVREVLSRHVPSKADTADLQSRLDLIRKLRVPEKWILLAQAHRAKYEGKSSLEAEYLVGAQQWNAAHKVLLEQLLPDAVLADDLQSIFPLLEKMKEAAERHEVSGWETGGQALYYYIQVCDEIYRLVSSEARRDRMLVSSRLEALRPKVAAACRALGGHTPTSGRGRLARAEMGARLVSLALAAGAAHSHLATLLKALKLPPDSTHLKITSLLAETCGSQ